MLVDDSEERLAGRHHEAVADVADRADVVLVLGAELGAEATHVHVDGAGAAEVVVAPHLLQQLLAAEDAAGVLGEVLEELELLVGEVERAAADARGVGRVVDDDLAPVDHVGGRVVRGLGAGAADREPDPGLELGRTAGVQHHVVHAPVVGDDRETALGDDEEDRRVGTGRADQPAEVARGGEVLATVDEDEVGRRSVEQRTALGGQDLHGVREERQSREHLGRGLERTSQQQECTHGADLLARRSMRKDIPHGGCGRARRTS